MKKPSVVTRVTLKLNHATDQDIIDYLGTNRTYKLREAVRKAIQFDKTLEQVFRNGISVMHSGPSGTPEVKLTLDDGDEDLIETTDKEILLTKEEILEKLDQF